MSLGRTVFVASISTLLCWLPSFAVGQSLIPAVDELGKWGYVSRLGSEPNWVIRPQYDLVGKFDLKTALAPVQNSRGEWGYIDRAGEVKIPFQFSAADEFSENVAAVQRDGYLQYILPTGSVLLETRFEWGEQFCEEVAVVKPRVSERNYGVIDRKGQFVVKPGYRFLSNCSSGLLSAQRQDGSWTYLRKNGGELPVKFTFAGKFEKGFAVVMVGDRYGIINQEMEFVVKPQKFQIYILQNAVLLPDDKSIDVSEGSFSSKQRLIGAPCGSINQFESMILQSPSGFAQIEDESGKIFKLESNPTVEVSLISTPEKADIYRPSRYEYERAEKSGDIDRLLTPDYRCPVLTSDKCKFSKYTDYRLIFVLGSKREVRKCIPSIDQKIEVEFK